MTVNQARSRQPMHGTIMAIESSLSTSQVTGRRQRLSEQLQQLLVTEGKNASQVGTNKKPIDQTASGDRVVHVIFNEGSAIAFFERMQMPPETIRPV
jgi:hypothetical protein